jgi:hypothetical protein
MSCCLKDDRVGRHEMTSAAVVASSIRSDGEDRLLMLMLDENVAQVRNRQERDCSTSTPLTHSQHSPHFHLPNGKKRPSILLCCVFCGSRDTPSDSCSFYLQTESLNPKS